MEGYAVFSCLQGHSDRVGDTGTRPVLSTPRQPRPQRRQRVGQGKRDCQLTVQTRHFTRTGPWQEAGSSITSDR